MKEEENFRKRKQEEETYKRNSRSFQDNFYNSSTEQVQPAGILIRIKIILSH